MPKLNILLTNDDGIHAEGLWILHAALQKKHCVTVVAPDQERSAVGHGITIRAPLRVTSFNGVPGKKGYAINGTPADCVKIGILQLLEKKPDIVVSGINPGANVGVNINYSGTVAGAREGALYGSIGVAASSPGYDSEGLRLAAEFICKLTETAHERGLPFGTFLNVNFPDGTLTKETGVSISRQGIHLLKDCFEKRNDPRERPYYWQSCDPVTPDKSIGVDTGAIKQNRISITPLRCDATDYKAFNDLEDWGVDAV